MSTVDNVSLERMIVETGLADRRLLISTVVRNSIRVRPGKKIDGQDYRAGMSKAGGLPDLLPDVLYPTWRDESLSFLAQISLADLARHDVDNLLPHHGLLSFFYHEASWYSDHHDINSWRVLYYDCDGSLLKQSA